jgi:hypothetical protein
MPSQKPLIAEIREEALQKLQRFAVRHGHTQDPYLVLVNDALESGKNPQSLAILEPNQFLPSKSKTGPNSKTRLARLIAGIRNVLIFVPVALTWAAVGEATIAFNEFVQRNSGTPANFLQFWQDGYGILDPFWSIGNIATIDFYLVSTIIVLTGIVSVLQAFAQRERSDWTAEFEIERRELAFRLELLRYPRRPASADELPRDIRLALGELRSALAKAQSGKESAVAARRLEKQIQAANLAIQKMETLAIGLDRSARSITSALNQITKTAQRTAKQSSTSATALNRVAKRLDGVASSEATDRNEID